jgi:hypothetical protein
MLSTTFFYNRLGCYTVSKEFFCWCFELMNKLKMPVFGIMCDFAQNLHKFPLVELAMDGFTFNI